MAITFTELRRDNGGTNVSTHGPIDTVRRFLVPGATDAIVLADTDLINQAAVGSAHPDFPSLRVNNLRVGEAVGSGDDVGFIVEAVYGRPGGGVSVPPPDRQDLNLLISASTSHYTEEVHMPIMVKTTIVRPPFAELGEAWNELPNKVTITVRGIRMSIEFNTTTYNMASVSAVASQVNKIHQFGGRDWVFRTASADQIYRDGVWNVTYQWETEEGTSNDLIQDMVQEITNDGAAEIAPIQARPSFGKWVVIKVYESPPGLYRPFVSAFVPHVVDPAGYQSLPGYGDIWNL